MTNWFGGILEIRRLTAENETLGGRVAFLEGERERLVYLVLERDLLLTDRIITKQGGYAMSDEAKSNINTVELQARRDQKTADELQAHLDAKLARLHEDAKEAGRSATEADARFIENKGQYEQEFYGNMDPYL